eukprot:824452-Rhodomonas_salina.1
MGQPRGTRGQPAPPEPRAGSRAGVRARERAPAPCGPRPPRALPPLRGQAPAARAPGPKKRKKKSPFAPKSNAKKVQSRDTPD